MRIEAAAQHFLKYLGLERGCSKLTVQAYASDLRKLLVYLKDSGVAPDIQALTPLVVRRYVSWLADGGSSPATVARGVSAISSLFKYLISYGHAATNPCTGVPLPRKQKRMPAVLTTDDARRILKASEDHVNPRMAFRNRGIIATLLFSGLRRAELAALRVADVDLRSGWLKVRNGKGGKGRSVPLVRDAIDALADWLEFRPEVEHDYLFTGLRGTPLGAHGVSRMFTQVAKRAGVHREGVSVHTLRHTFASLLLQEGSDLVSIQQLLGHADLSSTAVYLHMDASHLRAAVEHHPLRDTATACLGS